MPAGVILMLFNRSVTIRTRALWFCVAGLAVFGILVGAGCKKSPPPSQTQALEQGVAQLGAALASANAEVRKYFSDGVVYGIRYRDYPRALDGLQQIIQDPSITEPQKKLANELMALVKEKVQITTNSPASQ